MSDHSFLRRSQIPVPPEDAFDWYERPGAFERLVAPWRPVGLQSATDGIRDGSTVTISVPAGPLRLPWIFEHSGYQRGVQFKDRQVSGPFKKWEHTHRFLSVDDAWFIEDQINYSLPLGVLGEWANERLLKAELERLFRYRHNITVHDLGVHDRFGDRERLSVLVSGGSGLIGSSLSSFMTTGGHKVTKLTRKRSDTLDDFHTWDPKHGVLSPTAVSGFDCIIHLSGSNIGERWNDSTMRKIRDSRVQSTRLLCEGLARASAPPKVLVCASAIGYYGDRGNEELTEESPAGNSFLAEVVTEWEAATQAARDAGIRVVNARFGVVLSPHGGAIQRMWRPFSFGLGCSFGDGQQIMSWISIHDLVAAIEHICYSPSLIGPVNLSSPNPISNLEFSQTFAKAINRTCRLRITAPALRLAFGKMADETLLASARVLPAKLLKSNFVFSLPQIGDAIRFDLGVPGDRV